MWFVLNCVPKSTVHVMTVLSVPTSPASSLRSPSSVLCCCFYRLGSRQEQRTTSSLHQHSCLLGCMYPLPSMSHPLPSLSPRRDRRGLTNETFVSLQPLPAPAQCPRWLMFLQGQGLGQADGSGHQVHGSVTQVRGCVTA